MSQQKNTITLNNGVECPLMGFGTYDPECDDITPHIVHAICSGYRHIDGAFFYQNENQVGEGIRQGIEKAGIKRSDLFVVNKVWPNRMHPDTVESQCRTTLANLGLDYLDLYLIHWPYAYKQGDVLIPEDKDRNILYDHSINPTDTWLAMEKLVEKGLVKSIGLSNFNSKQIQDVLDKGKIKPVMNQVESHPYLVQKKLVDFCRQKGIVVTAYSPFGMAGAVVLKEPVIQDMAKRLGKSVAQVALRWQVQRGVVAIPKSIKPHRIIENFDVFNFDLSEEDVRTIDALDRGAKGRINYIIKVPGANVRDEEHPHYPFKLEF